MIDRLQISYWYLLDMNSRPLGLLVLLSQVAVCQLGEVRGLEVHPTSLSLVRTDSSASEGIMTSM